ncbi:MAG: MBL fold metallo-hydrolase, partial [Bacteroidota bacterium]
MRYFFLFLIFLISCNNAVDSNIEIKNSGLELMVVGTAQDAGFPQMNCFKDCCKDAQGDPSKEVWVSCLSVIDHENKTYYFFDATPDFDKQNDFIKSKFPSYKLDGIFLTHAHIGHYTGLMYLGREVIGAKQIPVYAMPRMEYFLMHNGPWIQLYKLGNIDLIPMKADSSLKVSPL